MELEGMEKAAVIRKVTEPTEWVKAMHIVHKPNDKLCICLDTHDHNKVILHEHFKIPTREETMAKISGATIFSKIDCSKRFWHLKLGRES